MRMRNAGRALWARRKELVVDVVGFLGLGAVVHGVEMVYRPAGWMVGGVMLVALAVLAGRRTS